MTLLAASSMIFLAICLVTSGAAFSRAFCDARSQCPSDPISMLCRLETIPFISRSLVHG